MAARKEQRARTEEQGKQKGWFSMLQWYWKGNRIMFRVLWTLVVIGLLASLPIAVDRVRTESSSKKVEFVMDYRDLLEISAFRPDPQGFVTGQLDRMRQAGIKSAAVYEATLAELQLARRIDLFNSREAAALTGKLTDPRENATYLLFTDDNVRAKLLPEIEYWFGKLQAPLEPWSHDGRSGLKIGMPPEEATLKPLGPDPMALEALKAKNLVPVARISNRHQPFVPEDMDRILAAYANAGTKTLIVEGDYVPGFPINGTSRVGEFAELMQKRGLSLATVELIKVPAGLGTLAQKLDYNALRAHSFTEADAEKLAFPSTKEQLDARIRETADRFVLAVKDRNIKMIFLNARATRNLDKAAIADPLEPLYRTLQGPDGVISRIRDAGYVTGEGPAHGFDYKPSAWHAYLKPVVALGAVALIALTLSFFFPSASFAFFLLGLAGMAGLYVLSPGLLYKLLALGAGICAPSLAMIYAMGRIRSRTQKPTETWLGFTINTFIRASLTSLIGAVFVIGLLSGVKYSLMFDQFTGVKVLGLLPLVVVGLYLLFFSDGYGADERVRKAKKLLASPVTVLWVAAAAVLGGAMLYYMSRTGNEGQVSGAEMAFRGFLENALGVRPRTKEFLIGHPLFLFGAYLCVKYKRMGALWVFLFGVIGQVDMVGTFTHLHTPLFISAIRVGYGLLFGAVIGLILIGIWNLFARGWRRWAEAYTD